MFIFLHRLSCDDLAGTATGGGHSGIGNLGTTEAEQQLMAEVVR